MRGGRKTRLGTTTSNNHQRSMAKPLVISIEGNIGVGKTTVIDELQRILSMNTDVAVLREPVEEWESRGFLAAMYDGKVDPSSFQHMVLMSLAGDLLHKLNERDFVLIITERSAKGNYHVFGKANLVDGTVEQSMYKFTYERVMNGFPPCMQQSFIHLKGSTATVKARMATRGREAEQDVADSYLDKLGTLHDQWLAEEADVTTIYVDNMTKQAVLHYVAIHINFAIVNYTEKYKHVLTDKQKHAFVKVWNVLSAV